MKRVFKKKFFGKNLIVEHGQLAKQATGSVLVRYGDTVVLTAVVVNKNVNLLSDFFPLTVNYQEKLYSVGKIPGGFIKREGRPTENATLAARMIDRPMRPLFPEDFKNEVQIINTVLSVEPDCSPELTALFASSLATSISKIPFNGPVAGVKVGYIDKEYVINPTHEQLENSLIDLTVAGTKDAINMVESSAHEASEKIMLEGLMKGHEALKELVAFQDEIISEIGEEKMEYEHLEISKELEDEVRSLATNRLDKALRIKEKLKMHEAVDGLKEEIVEKYRAENIIERLVELKTKENQVFNKKPYKSYKFGYGEMKYPFIEYMSYKLKKTDKDSYDYIEALEDSVEKMGTNINDVIKKEHFDIAIKKVLMGNCITTLKNISRIDFQEIFEKINGVEEILKLDPAEVYDKMDYKTKAYYRGKIKELSKKTKISEVYIAKKIVELGTGKQGKKSHIGYYLIDEGKAELYRELELSLIHI